MDLGIRGRSALVWGGSRGVGRAVAAALAAEGADIAVCARKKWAAEQVAGEVVNLYGVRATGYGTGGLNGRSTMELVERIAAEFGGVDLLLGIHRRPKLEEREGLSPDAWATQFESGFLRLKSLTEALLSDMRDRKWGRVLWMIPPDGASTKLERQVHRLISGLLTGWLTSITGEFSDCNVTLNVLMAGAMSKDSVTATPRLSSIQRGRRENGEPATTPVSARQVAAVCAFLLADLAGCIRGETIRLDRHVGPPSW